MIGTVCHALLSVLGVVLAMPVEPPPRGATLRIEVRTGDTPIPGVALTVNGSPHTTGPDGRVTVEVPAGSVEIVAVHEGFVPVSTTLTLAAADQRDVVIALEPQPEMEEEITVSATRTDKRLEDQPMRVEVLAREEIEEKMLMTPGDIVMMLNEMGGMRVQATSPSLGAASVRIQGMRGRYTRFLSDGLPLFGEQVGALGLLQIPPMDLGQVEVIKGVASSMYGAGAMGGVVNLISRRPGAKAMREALVNQSTRGSTDAVLFYGGPLAKGWGLTTLAGGHWQIQQDVNNNRWANLPSYQRGVFRPRLFWDGGNGRTFFATTGVTIGIATAELSAAPSSAYWLPVSRSAGHTTIRCRTSGQALIAGRYVVTARAVIASSGTIINLARSSSAIATPRHSARSRFAASPGVTRRVAGVAVEHDGYTPRDVPHSPTASPCRACSCRTTSRVRKWLSVSASARLDHHNEYGTFMSPRISALLRSGAWNSRVSVGTGFFGPSALTEETEAAGLSRLTIPVPLRAENGRSASLDLTRSEGPAYSSLQTRNLVVAVIARALFQS